MRQNKTPEYARTKYHSQLAKMSFDETLDLTAVPMINIVYIGGHTTYIPVHKGEVSVRMDQMPTRTWYTVVVE